MSNTVKVVFAGDTRDVESAFDRVGRSSKETTDKIKSNGDAFDRVGERADEVDTKAMGFRDTLTGIQDTTAGLKKVASGDWGFESLLLLGAGIGDLASGMFNFLVPAFKAAVTWVKALNLAFLSSPVFWVIAAIVALIAVIVLIAVKTDWFQRAWRASWGWIKSAAGTAGDWIRDKWNSVLSWFRALPGRLGSALVHIADVMTRPFRTAFNAIARLWNSTIGRLSWSVPSWVPFIGGNSISVPHLPTFHSGGIVPGPAGREQLAVVRGGERFEGPGGSATVDSVTVVVKLDNDVLIEGTARGVRRRGGNVQLVLGT